MSLNAKPIIMTAVFSLAPAILIACSSGAETPLPTRTPEPDLCDGGGGGHTDNVPVVAVTDRRDGYVWILPDGTDAGVTAEQVRSADLEANESTILRIQTAGGPAVSGDHLSAAAVFSKRPVASQSISSVVVISTSEKPVSAIFNVPGDLSQALVLPQWLPTLGCLSVLVNRPASPDGGRLYLVDKSGDLKAEIAPVINRGSVLDSAGGGWLIIDQTLWLDEPSAEFVNINDPGARLLVAADDPFPALSGVEFEPGISTAAGVARIRAR